MNLGRSELEDAVPFSSVLSDLEAPTRQRRWAAVAVCIELGTGEESNHVD